MVLFYVFVFSSRVYLLHFFHSYLGSLREIPSCSLYFKKSTRENPLLLRRGNNDDVSKFIYSATFFLIVSFTKIVTIFIIFLYFIFQNFQLSLIPPPAYIYILLVSLSAAAATTGGPPTTTTTTFFPPILLHPSFHPSLIHLFKTRSVIFVCFFYSRGKGQQNKSR